MGWIKKNVIEGKDSLGEFLGSNEKISAKNEFCKKRAMKPVSMHLMVEPKAVTVKYVWRMQKMLVCQDTQGTTMLKIDDLEDEKRMELERCGGKKNVA
jgi:hypothetical protein